MSKLDGVDGRSGKLKLIKGLNVDVGERLMLAVKKACVSMEELHETLALLQTEQKETLRKPKRPIKEPYTKQKPKLK